MQPQATHFYTTLTDVTLGCALRQRACRDNVTGLYRRVPRLFTEFEIAWGDGGCLRLFRKLIRADLAVHDNWGPDQLTSLRRRDLMEPVEQRHEKNSIAITIQLPVDA